MHPTVILVNSWCRRILLQTVLLGAAGLLLSHTVAGLVLIPSGSMEPTMKAGDYLLVNRLEYGLHVPFTADAQLFQWARPQRGDIIIFNAPPRASVSEALFIKRVVAVAGDKVEVRNHRLVVNSKPATYAGAGPNAFTESGGGPVHDILVGSATTADYGPYVVPLDHVFVMGDHRNQSADSRVWGPLALTRVRGRAVARVLGMARPVISTAWLH